MHFYNPCTITVQYIIIETESAALTWMQVFFVPSESPSSLESARLHTNASSIWKMYLSTSFGFSLQSKRDTFNHRRIDIECYGMNTDEWLELVKVISEATEIEVEVTHSISTQLQVQVAISKAYKTTLNISTKWMVMISIQVSSFDK